jgi:aspartyl-tRNA(Asn)/glutamyl-tRNA(Gln) amidotransferase subunit C
MEVDKNLVEEVGSVMKLEFTDSQINTLVNDINKSISMFEDLAELDTEDVEGTFHGTVERHARLREDEVVQNQDEVKALLENAPNTKDQLIQVPAILDDGEGGA